MNHSFIRLDIHLMNLNFIIVGYLRVPSDNDSNALSSTTLKSSLEYMVPPSQKTTRVNKRFVQVSTAIVSRPFNCKHMILENSEYNLSALFCRLFTAEGPT